MTNSELYQRVIQRMLRAGERVIFGGIFGGMLGGIFGRMLGGMFEVIFGVSW